jgi:hypothetical protein
MVISNQNKTSVYFPKEIFSHILSYNDNSLNRHKEKQKYINEFFDELRYNKSLTYEDFHNIFNSEVLDCENEVYDFIIEEMVDWVNCRDISLFLLHN